MSPDEKLMAMVKAAVIKNKHMSVKEKQEVMDFLDRAMKSLKDVDFITQS